MDLVNKYRPTKLGQVIGQPTTVATLRGLLKERSEINPVTLFCGPHSTGKTTLAWLLTLYANCKDPQDGEACRKCDSCKGIITAIKNGRDSQCVTEKPVDDRGIDAIRRLQDQAKYRAPHRYRWFILDEVHNLTPQAFDAALRFFEKPPKQARFVLCTTEPHKLPRTIMSRNLIFNLQPIAAKDTARLLYAVSKHEGYDVDKKSAMKIAKAVHGAPRDALNLLSQVVAASNGGIKPEDLPRLIESAEAAQGYIVIRRYLKAIFAGKSGAALFLLRHVTGHDYFVTQVIGYLQQVLYWWISPDKLMDPGFDQALKEIEPPSVQQKSGQLEQWATMMQHCVDAQARIKQYTSDPRAVLEVLTIRLGNTVKNWLEQ